MRDRRGSGYPIIFASGTDMRVLDVIHAGQARFLDECGSSLGIAGRSAAISGRIRLLGTDPSRLKNESAIGACLLGDDNDDVPDWSKGLENMPPERRDSLGGAGFSSETGHSIGYDDRVVGCDP